MAGRVFILLSGSPRAKCRRRKSGYDTVSFWLDGLGFAVERSDFGLLDASTMITTGADRFAIIPRAGRGLTDFYDHLEDG